MFVYPPGRGCNGFPWLVQPGDDLTFSSVTENIMKSNFSDVTSSRQSVGYSSLELMQSTQDSFFTTRPYNEPAKEEHLVHKHFSPATMKKVK